jgi:hypothetical protein
MDAESEILARLLMADAAEYIRQGLMDEATEIAEVAEAIEMGDDPFCNFGQADIDQTGVSTSDK